jgi:hypothetical protein
MHKKMFDMPGGIEIVLNVALKDFVGIAEIYLNGIDRKHWRKTGWFPQSSPFLPGGCYV